MNSDTGEKERQAERHADAVLERRNRAFRILYDTVLSVVELKGRSIYFELCKSLREIAGSSGAALAVCNPDAETLTFEAYSCIHGVSLIEIPDSVAFSNEQIQHYINSQWSKATQEDNWLSRLFPSSHIVNHIESEVLSVYEVSCTQDGELIALCLLLYPQGVSPKMKDMVNTYLHVTGLTIRREQATRMLVESEQKYRKLVETTGTGYLLLTPDYKVLDANLDYILLSGHAQLSDIYGRCMSEWVAPDSREIFERARYQCVDSGYARNVQLEFLHSNGDSVPVEINFATNKSGEDGIIIGLCRDVSERKALEAHIQHMQRIEVVGRMAGGIAHDFNNILFSVMGFSQLALRKLKADSIEFQNVQEVICAARRGKELVEQILIFSRWRERKICAVLLQEVVQDSLSSLSLMVPHNVEVVQNFHCNSSVVEGDAVRLKHAITNICSNALQSMTGNGGVLTIELVNVAFTEPVWAEGIKMQPGEYVKLSISDTGHGIAPKDRRRIFEPFFTTKGAGGGTGLGLAAVQGIVEEHSGGIIVRSELGNGATFELYFPISLSDFSSDEITKLRTRTQHLPIGNGVVMVVDDEQTLSALLKQMLSELGYKVSAYIDPEEAFGHYKCNPSFYDLVIVDQAMPRMKGMQLAKDILAIRSDAKIILMTGFSEDITPEEAERQGCYRCLIKPVEFEVLAKSVAEAVGFRECVID